MATITTDTFLDGGVLTIRTDTRVHVTLSPPEQFVDGGVLTVEGEV